MQELNITVLSTHVSDIPVVCNISVRSHQKETLTIVFKDKTLSLGLQTVIGHMVSI